MEWWEKALAEKVQEWQGNKCVKLQEKLMEYAKSIDEEFHDLLWYTFNGIEGKLIENEAGNYQLSMPTKYLKEATIVAAALEVKIKKYETGLWQLMYLE